MMKNPLDVIGYVELGRTSYLFGFSWKFGWLIYLQASVLIHPLLLLLVLHFSGRSFAGHETFFSLESLIALGLGFIIMGVGFGYRVVVSKEHFKLHLTMLFIPYKGFTARTADVRFEEGRETDSEGTVCIYKDSDPWAEMSFEDWVQVSHAGKKYDIGDNGNYATLYAKIKEAVEKHVRPH
jgi:hypothetical protein